MANEERTATRSTAPTIEMDIQKRFADSVEMTVHSTSVTSTKIQNETIHPSEKRITGQWPVIFCPGLAATLPMLLLATLILYVIIQYRIDLVNIQEYPTNTYFFLRDISANIILSLTTCASILSLTLIPAMLTLASFLPSNRLLRISEKRELSMSPQTFDFALLIGVLYGSFGSYCSSIRQISKRPFKAHSVLRHTIFIFTGIILSSILIIFSDICIHVTTCTLALPTTISIQASGSSNYGRSLSTDCFVSVDSNLSTFEISMSNEECTGRMDLVMGGDEAYRTALDESTLNRAVTLNFSGQKDFYNASISILADAQDSSHSLFIASTYGVATYFTAIGADCQIDGSDQTWNCSDHHFNGQITHPISFPHPEDLIYKSNVIKWALAVKVSEMDNTFTQFIGDPDYAVTNWGESLFTVMDCETAVYNVTYFKAGGRYLPQFIEPVNQTVARLILSPIFPGTVEGYAGFGSDILSSQFTALAAIATTPKDLVRSWSQSFSKLAITSAAGIMIPAPVHLEDTMVIAVPKAPILLLWATTLLYAVFALGLVVAAVRNVVAHCGVRDVQARLSIEGVVAQFDSLYETSAVRSIKDLFDHSTNLDDYSNTIQIYRSLTGGWFWGSPVAQQWTNLEIGTAI